MPDERDIHGKKEEHPKDVPSSPAPKEKEKEGVGQWVQRQFLRHALPWTAGGMMAFPDMVEGEEKEKEKDNETQSLNPIQTEIAKEESWTALVNALEKTENLGKRNLRSPGDPSRAMILAAAYSPSPDNQKRILSLMEFTPKQIEIIQRHIYEAHLETCKRLPELQEKEKESVCFTAEQIVYAQAVRARINPQEKPITALVGGAGPDQMTSVHMLGAETTYVVDTNIPSIRNLDKCLELWEHLGRETFSYDTYYGPVPPEERRTHSDLLSGMTTRKAHGYWPESLIKFYSVEFLLLYELKCMGVERSSITVRPEKNAAGATIGVHLEYVLHGKKRTMIYFEGNLDAGEWGDDAEWKKHVPLVDAIVMKGVLDIVNTPERPHRMRSLDKLLKAGGHMILGYAKQVQAYREQARDRALEYMRKALGYAGISLATQYENMLQEAGTKSGSLTDTLYGMGVYVSQKPDPEKDRPKSVWSIKEASSTEQLTAILREQGAKESDLSQQTVERRLKLLVTAVNNLGKKIFVVATENGPIIAVASSEDEVTKFRTDILAANEAQASFGKMVGNCGACHQILCGIGITDGIASARGLIKGTGVYEYGGYHVLGYKDKKESGKSLYIDITANIYTFNRWLSVGKPPEGVANGLVVIDELGSTELINKLYQGVWQRELSDGGLIRHTRQVVDYQDALTTRNRERLKSEGANEDEVNLFSKLADETTIAAQKYGIRYDAAKQIWYMANIEQVHTLGRVIGVNPFAEGTGHRIMGPNGIRIRIEQDPDVVSALAIAEECRKALAEEKKETALRGDREARGLHAVRGAVAKLNEYLSKPPKQTLSDAGILRVANILLRDELEGPLSDTQKNAIIRAHHKTVLQEKFEILREVFRTHKNGNRIITACLYGKLCGEPQRDERNRQRGLWTVKEATDIKQLTGILKENGTNEKSLATPNVEQKLAILAQKTKSLGKKLFVVMTKNGPVIVVASNESEVQQFKTTIVEADDVQAAIHPERFWKNCVFCHDFMNQMGTADGLASTLDAANGASHHQLAGSHTMAYKNSRDGTKRMFIDITAKIYAFSDTSKASDDATPSAENAIANGLFIIDEANSIRVLNNLYASLWSVSNLDLSFDLNTHREKLKYADPLIRINRERLERQGAPKEKIEWLLRTVDGGKAIAAQKFGLRYDAKREVWYMANFEHIEELPKETKMIAVTGDSRSRVLRAPNNLLFIVEQDPDVIAALAIAEECRAKMKLAVDLNDVRAAVDRLSQLLSGLKPTLSDAGILRVANILLRDELEGPLSEAQQHAIIRAHNNPVMQEKFEILRQVFGDLKNGNRVIEVCLSLHSHEEQRTFLKSAHNVVRIEKQKPLVKRDFEDVLGKIRGILGKKAEDGKEVFSAAEIEHLVNTGVFGEEIVRVAAEERTALEGLVQQDVKVMMEKFRVDPGMVYRLGNVEVLGKIAVELGVKVSDATNVGRMQEEIAAKIKK